MSTQQRERERLDSDPDSYWLERARDLEWEREPTVGYRDGTWFADGTLNATVNMLDRHVDAGFGARVAIAHDSPVTGTTTSVTYAELRDDVARFASVLEGLGVSKGDTVTVYMPNIPQAVMAMLGCARIGAVHCVVFGGFAPRELAQRIADVGSKVVVTASCGIERDRVIPYKPLVDEALQHVAHEVEHVVVFQREQHVAELDNARDHDWDDLMRGATPREPVVVPATHPLYVLHTSGTTGQPKGVVHETGGYLTGLHWSMDKFYGVAPGDVYWAASDVGWVVGHSYIVYGPLVRGCTTVLYEGKPVGTPDAGAFWRVVQDHGVNVMFVAPTAIRAIRQADPGGQLLRRADRSSLRHCFLAGERSDTDTVHWLADQLSIPVVDHYWQTETGWPITGTCIGLGETARRVGAAGMAVPGYDVRVLDDAGEPTAGVGNLAVRLPLPPGCSNELWGWPDGFERTYLERFDGYYDTGDAGLIADDGFVWVHGRVDDVMNVAGHRLSASAMEEVIVEHPGVTECVVVGRRDELKGEVPVAFLVLHADHLDARVAIRDSAVATVRERIGPVAALREAYVVPVLPKTRSGKTLRRCLKAILDGDEVVVPPTIEDATALDQVSSVVNDVATTHGRQAG